MAINLPYDEQSLRRYLQPKIRIIVETILENIQEVNKDTIDKIVYGAGTPNEYHRTGQFADLAWDNRINHSTLYEIEGEFYYKPDGMTDIHPSLRDSQQYGSAGQDERAYLAEIIYEGVAGHIFGEGFWTKSRDAWSELVKIVGSDKMRKWIIKGANKARLTISWD